MKKSIIAVVSLWSILLLVGCDSEKKSNNEVQDIRKMVQEYSASSNEGVSASITSNNLIVKDEDDKKKTYDLPEEEFFVSIAPYVNETHPCEVHSLTGCQGEMVNADFDVMIQDEEGNVIVDETMTSLDNGFIDIWLPRNQTYQVKINYGEKATESKISTFEGDNTCITTMQLI